VAALAEVIAAQGEGGDAPLPPLRDYQALAVGLIRRRLSEAPATFIEVPTGGGKTRIIAEVARLPELATGRVLAVAHTDVLVEQLARGIRATGIVKARQDDVGASLIAASVQTLSVRGRLDRVLDASPPVSLLVVDECHHATAPTWERLIGRCKDAGAKVLGVSATPFRADGADLEEVFGPPAFARSIAEMVEAGWLVPVSWRRVRLPVNFRHIPRRAGDFTAAGIEAALSPHSKAVAERTASLIDGRPTVVYAATVAHAHELAEAFRRVGVAAGVVHGQQDHDERDRVLDEWRSGTLRVVCNCQLLTEGFDYPELAAVVVSRPTRSQTLYVQMVGRGLRPAAGKDDCLVLDVVGQGNLADPDQVVLPVVMGEALSEEEVAALDADDRPSSDPVERAAAQHERESLWLWRPVPGHADCRYASLGERTVALVRRVPDGSGLVRAYVLDTEKRRVEWASEHPGSRGAVVRALIKRLRPWEVRVLARKDARWRALPPTGRQTLLIERLGLPKQETRGDAAAAITDFFTRRAVEALKEEL
jgi:superfamily II DNA or RNA helicase